MGEQNKHLDAKSSFANAQKYPRSIFVVFVHLVTMAETEARPPTLARPVLCCFSSRLPPVWVRTFVVRLSGSGFSWGALRPSVWVRTFMVRLSGSGLAWGALRPSLLALQLCRGFLLFAPASLLVVLSYGTLPEVVLSRGTLPDWLYCPVGPFLTASQRLILIMCNGVEHIFRSNN